MKIILFTAFVGAFIAFYVFCVVKYFQKESTIKREPPKTWEMTEQMTAYTKECNQKGGVVFAAGDWLYGEYLGCNLPKEATQ